MEPADQPPVRPRRRPSWWWLALVVVVLAVALVWALGGFRGGSESTEETTNRPFDIGAATLTVTGATAKRSYDDRWTVTVETLCTVTAQQPPNDLSEGFALGSTTRPVVVAEDYSVTIAPNSTAYGPHRDYLGPDLAPMVCAFRGTMPATWQPSTGIRLGFTDLQYGDNSVTADQAEHWYPGSVTHLLRLPVTVLPQS